jgi:hypothetical protein
MLTVLGPQVVAAKLLVRGTLRDGGAGHLTTLGVRTRELDRDAQCDGVCTFARIGMSPKCVCCRLGNGQGAFCTPATFESCSGGATVAVPLDGGKPGRVRLTVTGVRYVLRCRPSARCRQGNAE